MEILVCLGLVAGYAWSVWWLARQRRFDPADVARPLPGRRPLTHPARFAAAVRHV